TRAGQEKGARKGEERARTHDSLLLCTGMVARTARASGRTLGGAAGRRLGKAHAETGRGQLDRHWCRAAATTGVLAVSVLRPQNFRSRAARISRVTFGGVGASRSFEGRLTDS